MNNNLFCYLPCDVILKISLGWWQTSYINRKQNLKEYNSSNLFLFGLALWHINHSRLLNAESRLDIYTRHVICKHKSTKINVSKYCYVSLIIQLNNQSFVYTQLNDQTVLFQVIWFSISHLFSFCLNIKQFYLTHW